MKQRPWFVLAALPLSLTVIGASACGGRSAQPDTGSGTGAEGANDASGSDANATGALPVCGWPASLDPADASGGQCVAARLYLSCTNDAGDGESCLSNDPTQCPGIDPVVGPPFGGCVDLCHADEYAVGCGEVGPGSWPSPPASCRLLPPNPGGTTAACCPCAAASFACGSSACDAQSQVCEHVEGGPPPGVDFYQCVAIPAACTGDVTCACVVAALSGSGADACSASGSDLTVQVDVP